MPSALGWSGFIFGENFALWNFEAIRVGREERKNGYRCVNSFHSLPVLRSWIGLKLAVCFGSATVGEPELCRVDYVTLERDKMAFASLSRRL